MNKKNVESIYTMTPLQWGMAYESGRNPGSGTYVEQFHCRLLGELDAQLFERAWQKVVQRHHVFRTLYLRLDHPTPLQVVKKEVSLQFDHIDWSNLSSAESEECRLALLQSDRSEDFNFSVAPLIRMNLARVTADEYFFLWSYHHSILDGWSLPIVLDEVMRVYAASVAQNAASLKLADVTPYQHYVAWLSSRDYPAALQTWSEYLSGFNSANPLTRAECCDISETRRMCAIDAKMSQQSTQALEHFARTNQVTLNVICQAIWARLVATYSNNDDVVFGAVVSGRSHDLNGIKTLVGLLINTVPIRTIASAQTSLQELFGDLQRKNVQAEQNGFVSLAEIKNASEVPNQAQLFESIFVFENYPGHENADQVQQYAGITIEQPVAIEETDFPLALIVVPGKQLTINLTYDSSKIPHAMADSLVAEYQSWLELVCSADGQQSLDIFQHQRTPFNAGIRPKVDGHGYHQRIEQLAQNNPARTAITTSAGEISYQQIRLLGISLVSQLQQSTDDNFSGGIGIMTDDVQELLAAVYASSWLGVQLLPIFNQVDHQEIPSTLKRLNINVLVLGQKANFSQHELQTVRFNHNLPNNDSLELPASVTGDRIGGIWYRAKGAMADVEYGFFTYQQLCASSYMMREKYCLDQDSTIIEWQSDIDMTSIENILLSIDAGATIAVTEGHTFTDFINQAGQSFTSQSVLRLNHFKTRQLGKADHLATVLESQEAGSLVVDYQAASGKLFEKMTKYGHENLSPHMFAEHRLRTLCLPYCSRAWSEKTGWLIDQEDIFAGNQITLIDQNMQPVADYGMAHLMLDGDAVPEQVVSDDLDSWLTLTQDGTQKKLARAQHSVYAVGSSVFVSAGEYSSESFYTDYFHAASRQQVQTNPSKPLLVCDTPERDGSWVTTVLLNTNASGSDTVVAAQQFAQDLTGESNTIKLLDSDLFSHDAIDYQQLLTSSGGQYASSKRRLPETPTEESLQQIWATLLEKDGIGCDDNFFEVGGQSLTATVLLAEIEQQFGRSLSIEILIDQPTIGELGKILDSSDGELNELLESSRADLPSESNLDESIVPPQSVDLAQHRAKNVLLTGATGVLGSQMLADLCAEPDLVIYCLVRAADRDQGMGRLRSVLEDYRIWDDEFSNRIVPVCGNLQDPNFGLDAAEYSELTETIDTIFHSAAYVSFVYPYGPHKAVNVIGTEQILRFACTSRTKPLNYVSTIGVLDMQAELMTESLEVEYHENMLGGYEESKWVAEQLVCEAVQRGLPVAVYRTSRIVGHTATGVLNRDQNFSQMLEAIMVMKQVPNDLGFDNMMPVDYVSKAIVLASREVNAYGQAIHVISPKWNDYSGLVVAAEKLGFELEAIGFVEWMASFLEYLESNPESELAALVPIFELRNPRETLKFGDILPIEMGRLESLLGQDMLDSMPNEQTLFEIFLSYLISTNSNIDAINAVA